MANDERNSILIVDDETSNHIFLNHHLSPEYTVYAAKDGQDAIKKAREAPPDLILLDIIMPDMSGYAVISALKSYEETRDIPVIFITGLSSSEDERIGLASHAADYINKPFNAEIVKFRVKNQINIVNQMRTINRLSVTDQLTDIPNRRGFDNRIKLEWGRSVREKLPISVLLLDVDKFKTYNDTYGHQQGDAVLVKIASSIKNSLFRPADFAARWGGEEFIVLLPNTGLNGALSVAENIRANVEREPVPLANGDVTNVTVSVGVSELTPGQNDSADVFIKAADAALYSAKESGRNRVCH